MMSNDQRTDAVTHPRSRTPARISAFALGVIFVTAGIYEFRSGPAGWLDLGFAMILSLTGLLFAYSALTNDWRFPFVRRRAVSPYARFLMVEPVSATLTEVDSKIPNDGPRQSLNPYSPPREPPIASRLSDEPIQSSGSQSLREHFLAGSPFIHHGVVFFLDPNDESAIHAALPLSTSSELLARRNVSEAIRVMPEFLNLLPDMDRLARERQLVIRMISSYDDLANEIWDRIAVQPATAHAAQSEPSDRDSDAADRCDTG